MWKWHSGVTVSTAVYAFSRYGLLIGRFLQVATIYPMSDRVRSVDIIVSFTNSSLHQTEVCGASTPAHISRHPSRYLPL